MKIKAGALLFALLLSALFRLELEQHLFVGMIRSFFHPFHSALRCLKFPVALIRCR
jgi:hypothetical protein